MRGSGTGLACCRWRCIECGAQGGGSPLYCPSCGGLPLIEYKGAELRVDRREPSMWRYSNLLPPVGGKVSLGEGLTPVRSIGRGVWLKLETRNPTGSYADRASSLLASLLAQDAGSRVVVEYALDYTLSLAWYLRGRAILEVVVPSPHAADEAELLHLALLGSEIRLGPEPRRAGAVRYASSLTVEGLKTIALELAEQGVCAERLYAPAESGILALALWKGLGEARRLGLEPCIGKVVAVVLKGTPEPSYASLAGLSTERISIDEAIEAMIGLARRRVKAKLISAATVALAQASGGISVLTAAPRVGIPAVPKRESDLEKSIVKVLERLESATAYRIWLELEGRYTLRGVYKALKALEAKMRVCSKHIMEGRRKVKIYTLC